MAVSGRTDADTDALFLVDRSATARAHHADVRRVLEPLAACSRLATCIVVDLEVLYSARSPADYRRAAQMRRLTYRKLPITQEICDRALEVQGVLAERSQHRGASIPELINAACAERHEAVVLHYDADYDLVASVTGQEVRWIVPAGAVP